jgi:hypothetical protein
MLNMSINAAEAAAVESKTCLKARSLGDGERDGRPHGRREVV